MPRPRKCRKICCLPRINKFVPCDGEFTQIQSAETIFLSVDEYETIRLIDKEQLSQEECGVYMNVARTTVQQIYNNARTKIADALVNGFAIKIQGGDYRLCDGNEMYCGCGGCRRHRLQQKLIESKGEDVRK